MTSLRRYLVVQAFTLNSFEGIVQEKMEAGYIPTGGVFVEISHGAEPSEYYQAMWLPNIKLPEITVETSAGTVHGTVVGAKIDRIG